MASVVNMILRGAHKRPNRNWTAPRELVAQLPVDAARRRIVEACQATVEADRPWRAVADAEPDKKAKRLVGREALRKLGDGPLLVEELGGGRLQVTCRYRLVDKVLWVAVVSFAEGNGATTLTVAIDRFITSAEGVIQGKREYAECLARFADAVGATP